MLTDVRLVVSLPVSLARQIHYYMVESQLMVLQERHKEVEQMMQEGTYISTFGNRVHYRGQFLRGLVDCY
jgi:hypothetical protein